MPSVVPGETPQLNHPADSFSETSLACRPKVDPSNAEQLALQRWADDGGATAEGGHTSS
jgi:hypothetical protein